MSIRRLTLTILTTLCTLTAGLLGWGAPAQGAITHTYLSQLSGFGNATALAFGPDGELYVADKGDGSIDKFSASGAPLSFSAKEPYVEGSRLTGTPNGGFLASDRNGSPNGVAVSDATGDIYVSNGREEVVDVFSASGEYLFQLTEAPMSAPVSGPFGEIYNLAFDQATGDLYFTNPSQHVVEVFSSAGDYVSQIPTSEFADSVAINEATQDVYVPDRAPNALQIYDSTDASIATWNGASAPPGFAEGDYSKVGIGGANNHVYLGSDSSGNVDEFSSSVSEEFLDQIARTPTGPLGNPEAVAVNPSSNDVYIATENGVVDIFGPDVVVPSVTSSAASAVGFRGATLEGTVNPENVGPATCEFEWGTSIAFGKTAPCSENVADGSSFVPVEAQLSGLEPDMTYYYRLQASDANGTNSNEVGQVQRFATPGAGIRGESVSNAASSSATLEAQVDPNGAATTYYFEYGTTSSYGTDVPILGGSAPRGPSLGSAKGFDEVTEHVQELQPATVYHYRVVAVSEATPGVYETFYGAGQTFTTQAGGGELALPDGRDWEMVSPPLKDGAFIYPLGTEFYEALNVQASVDGNAIAFMTNAPTEAGPAGDGQAVMVLATRGASEWSSQDITPPHSTGTGISIGAGAEYAFFSEDLSLGLNRVIGDFDGLSPEATEQTPYLRTIYEDGNVNAHCAHSCYRPLVTSSNTPPGTEFGGTEDGACEETLCGPRFEGATPDLRHVVLLSWPELTSTAVRGGGGLYEWSAGKLQLVSFLPADEGGKAVHAELGGDENSNNWQQAISNDGSRVVWKAGEALYLRDMANEETIRLDLSQGTGGVSSHPQFMTASSDLSRIFFLDEGQLTANSTSAGGEDLYEYNLNAPVGSRLTDLTPGKNPGETGAVEGVIGASEDGLYVYYVAHGEIFEYYDGTTTAIAEPGAVDGSGAARDLAKLEKRTARVSPNGLWLAFQSARNLTGYDTDDVVSGVPDEEVYLYNGETHKLVCASCNPTGARPVGRQLEVASAANADSAFGGAWVSAVIPTWSDFGYGHSRFQSRFLSDRGRLFFDSNEALVPQDVNGTMDVYEYEPPGEGTCSTASVTFSERSSGCVGLISSGTSPQESSFMEASGTGGDVFFRTTAKLLPRDVDTAYDIYDAHECSAEVPCYPAAPVQPPACDTSESCKAAESPQPAIFGSPSSETFFGAGNITPSTEPAVAKKSVALTRAQKLAKALDVCHKKTKRAKRAACERKARKQLGAKSARRTRTSNRDGSARAGR
jgi:hypothetical protein